MSMYNAIFGLNSAAPFILAMLGKTQGDFGRFRDAYFNEERNIVIYTRCGGGNRDDYQQVFDEMSTHPYFIRDFDEDFDSTYASFEFKVPDQFKEQVDKLFDKSDNKAPADKWKDLFEAMDKKKMDDPIVQHAMEVGKKIFSEIEKTPNGGTVEI
jgi:hypothetical protein